MLQANFKQVKSACSLWLYVVQRNLSYTSAGLPKVEPISTNLTLNILVVMDQIYKVAILFVKLSLYIFDSGIVRTVASSH